MYFVVLYFLLLHCSMATGIRFGAENLILDAMKLIPNRRIGIFDTLRWFRFSTRGDVILDRCETRRRSSVE